MQVVEEILPHLFDLNKKHHINDLHCTSIRFLGLNYADLYHLFRSIDFQNNNMSTQGYLPNPMKYDMKLIDRCEPSTTPVCI